MRSSIYAENSIVRSICVTTVASRVLCLLRFVLILSRWVVDSSGSGSRLVRVALGPQAVAEAE